MDDFSIDLSDLGEGGIGQVVEVEPLPWMEDKKFTLVTTMSQLVEIIDKAIEAGHCAVDLETTGLDNRIDPDGKTVDKIVGYCLCYDGEEGIYVPVRHKDEDGRRLESNLDPKEVIKEIERLVENCITIYHNSAFDHEFLFGEGVDIDDFRKFEDTLILDYLRDSSDKRHGLKTLSKRFLGMEMISLKSLFPEGTKDRNFSTLDPNHTQNDGKKPTLLYAGSDAICTYLLFQFYKTHGYKPMGRGENGETIFECFPTSDPKQTILGGQKFVYYTEKINIPALRWMERNRPKVDLDYLKRVRAHVDKYLEETKVRIAEGIKSKGLTTFTKEDVSSPKKLGDALAYLNEKGLIKGKLETTPNGQVATGDDIIAKLAEKLGNELPFIKQITTFRKLQKVDGTYLKPLEENTDRDLPRDEIRRTCHTLDDNTIRFSFLPNRVDTGRYAGSKGKPNQGYGGINVQSIPAGYNVGKFSGKRVYRRPSGRTGEKNPTLYPNLVEAVEGAQGFLIHIEDGHFVKDPLNGDVEYCIRISCKGCPFADSCEHDPEPLNGEGEYERNVKILSLDSSVRPAIKAREGYVIAAIDQSGVELRVAASISQEPKWIEEFYRCSKCGTEFGEPLDITPELPVGQKKYEIPNKPPSACTTCGSDKIGDLHTLTTKIVYGDDVTKKPDFKQYRQKAKGANFAILYGGSGKAVARSTGVSKEEGNFIRKKVLSGLPRLNTWFSEVIGTCTKYKQVSTGVGRFIRLGDIDHENGWISSKAERNAINSIIQGTATGDLTKYCMGRVYQHMKKTGNLENCRLIITVHDELVFEIKKDKMDELFPVIVDIMTELGDKLKWPVPLSCDIEIGENFNVAYSWFAMHSVNPETGRADAPVPRFLWNHIDMKPGMWYIDDHGEEVIVEGDPEPEPEPEPEHVEEETTETPVEIAEEIKPQIYSELREHYMAIKKGRNKVAGTYEGPVFTFRLDNAPGLGRGRDPIYIRTMMRHLYQIFDFFMAEGSGSYALRLVDWQGEVIIDSAQKHLIEPEEFKTLARYHGLYGQEVR